MSAPKQYRKKPVVIEAMQYTGTNWVAMATWMREGGSRPGSRGDVLIIHTLEGSMSAGIGYYIVKGIQGQFYPCRPDIFAATYEEVSE